ncbi:hypothetical protein [Nocardia sp. R7R-8]|uniref:hypothetical protein n=1 Tax=Nocardia sp. R7R-8 TaxID=3459304 RepID=UPI00403D9E2C
MTAPPIPPLTLPAPWTYAISARTRTTTRLTLGRPGDRKSTVELQRCCTGRLARSYPANTHDIEIRTAGDLSGPELTDVLAVLVHAILQADKACRRIVFAATAGDQATIAAAEAADFRPVVDVDLPDAELTLLIAEPNWVTALDRKLDHVPGT